MQHYTHIPLSKRFRCRVAWLERLVRGAKNNQANAQKVPAKAASEKKSCRFRFFVSLYSPFKFAGKPGMCLRQRHMKCKRANDRSPELTHVLHLEKR